MGVVVVDVGAQYALELATACDQEPVEAVTADAADPAFGERVCLRSAKRSADDPDALAAESLVEGIGELAVAVVKSESAPLSLARRVTRRAAGLAGSSSLRGDWRSSPQNEHAGC